jgi:hypothetical protein
VRQHVELLYVASFYSIAERIDYANNKKFNPYPAEFDRIGGVPRSGLIECGHNPVR